VWIAVSGVGFVARGPFTTTHIRPFMNFLKSNPFTIIALPNSQPVMPSALLIRQSRSKSNVNVNVHPIASSNHPTLNSTLLPPNLVPRLL
jgi:hypothetical protein